MKTKLLLCLVPFLIALAVGCGKSVNSIPPPAIPSGTFTGVFRLLHRATNQVPFDTAKANITVTMNTSGDTYAVTGDTSTVHAGSHGSFAYNSQYLIFTDATFPATGVPTKTHLEGGYLYYYDGSTFQMLAYSADTIALQYDLRKPVINIFHFEFLGRPVFCTGFLF